MIVRFLQIMWSLDRFQAEMTRIWKFIQMACAPPLSQGSILPKFSLYSNIQLTLTLTTNENPTGPQTGQVCTMMAMGNEVQCSEHCSELLFHYQQSTCKMLVGFLQILWSQVRFLTITTKIWMFIPMAYKNLAGMSCAPQLSPGSQVHKFSLYFTIQLGLNIPFGLFLNLVFVQVSNKICLQLINQHNINYNAFKGGLKIIKHPNFVKL